MRSKILLPHSGIPVQLNRSGKFAFVFEDLDFVAIGISDEGHLGSASGELGFPIAGPNVFAIVFEHLTILHDIVYPEAGMHQVFGEFDLVVGRVGELERVSVSGQFQVHDLIARWALVIAFQDSETAVLAVPVDGLFQVAHSDSGVKKFDHAWELSEGLGYAKNVCFERAFVRSSLTLVR